MNIFLQSSGLHLIMSIIVPVIFAGLTAFETQQIKSWYYETDAGDVSSGSRSSARSCCTAAS